MITQAVAEKRASVINPLHPRDPGLADLFGFGRESAAGEPVTPTTAMRVAAFMAGVNYLSRTVASLPLDVYGRLEPRGREKLREHRLYERLHTQPNNFQTSFEWRVMMMHHLILRGNFYSRLTADGRLVPLHPDRVRPFWAPDGKRAYEYQPPQGAPATVFDRIILQQEMFHVGYMPDDGLKGRPVLDYQVDTIGRALAEQKYGAVQMKVGTRLSGVLTVKKRMSPEAKMSLREQWQQRNAGAVNAGGTAILEEDMDWKPVSMSNQAAQLAETWELTREDMAIILNVPPHKVGAMRRSTFSNIEHQAIEAVQDSIRPWCVNIEQAGDMQLFTEAERRRGQYMEFNLDGLLRGDFLTRQQGLEVQRRNGIIDGNDWADVENMNPFEGGEVRIVALNMVPLEQLSREQEADGQRRLSLPPRETRSLELMRRLRAAHQPMFEDGLRRVLRREADSVEREFRRHSQARSLAEFVSWLEAFYTDFRAVVSQTMTPPALALGETVARSAEEMVAAQETHDIGEFMASFVGALVARHVTASREALRGLMTDEDPETVLQRAAEIFAGWRSARAQRVAGSEVVRLSNAVARYVWQAAGVQRLAWWRAPDCEACGERAGRIVGIQDAFEGDLLHPPAGEGCGCTLIPVLGG